MKKAKGEMTTIRVSRATLEYLNEVKKVVELRDEKELTLEDLVLMAARIAFGADHEQVKDLWGKDE